MLTVEEKRAKATEYLRDIAKAIENDYVFNDNEIEYIKHNFNRIFEEIIKES